jgi:Tol biopolymer transport system component
MKRKAGGLGEWGTDMKNLHKLKFATFAVIACCVLSFASLAKTNGDELPRLPGEGFLVARFPDDLAVTFGQKTTQVQGGGDWAVVPSISADGRVIASARLVPGQPPKAKPTLIVGTYDIATRKWTDHKELAIKGGSVAISPDGSKLACSYMATGASLLHILDLKTGTISVGPAVTKYAGSLTWSPDNQRIAFKKDVERAGHGGGIPPLPAVFVLNVTDGTVSKIADGTAPSWSPSGEWIAFDDYSPGRDDGSGGRYADNADRVSVIHPNGTGSRVVTLLRPNEYLSLPPVWSPDSKALLLQRPQDESVNPRMDIYMLNLATLKLTRKFRRLSPVYGWVRTR